MKKLMTTTDVGNKFNVTVTTVKNWVREFNLPHERTMGGHMRFTEEQVQVMKDNIKQRWGCKMKAYAKNLSHTPNEIIFHRTLTDDEKLLVAVLYGFKPKNDGDTFPGQEILADIRGCNERTIARRLESLIKKGIITRTRIKNRKYHYTFTFDNKENFTIIPMNFLADTSTTDEEKITYIKLEQLKFTYAQGGNQYFITKLGIDIGRFYTIYGQLVKKGYCEDCLNITNKKEMAPQVVIEKPTEQQNNVSTITIIHEEPAKVLPKVTPAEKIVSKFYDLLNVIPTPGQRKFDTNTVTMATNDYKLTVPQTKEILEYMVMRKYKNMDRFAKSITEAHYYKRLSTPAGQAIKKYYDGMGFIIDYSMLKSNFEKADEVISNYNLDETQFDFVVSYMIKNKVYVFNYISNKVQAALAEWKSKKGNSSFNNTTPTKQKMTMREKQIAEINKLLERGIASGNQNQIKLAQDKLDEINKNTEVN